MADSDDPEDVALQQALMESTLPATRTPAGAPCPPASRHNEEHARWRMEREEQDREYKRARAADEMRKVQQTPLQSPPIPAAYEGPHPMPLRLRLPNGRVYDHVFGKSSSVREIWQLVRHYEPDHLPIDIQIRFRRPGGMEELDGQQVDQSLESANLQPREVLYVVWAPESA